MQVYWKVPACDTVPWVTHSIKAVYFYSIFKHLVTTITWEQSTLHNAAWVMGRGVLTATGVNADPQRRERKRMLVLPTLGEGQVYAANDHEVFVGYV